MVNALKTSRSSSSINALLLSRPIRQLVLQKTALIWAIWRPTWWTVSDSGGGKGIAHRRARSGLAGQGRSDAD
jgi:hypothetical protein